MRREYSQVLPGSTIHDMPTPDVFTWKQIALIVTAHTRVCEIYSCRNATPAAGPVCYVSHLSHSCFPSPNLPLPRAAIYHRVTRHARTPHAPFSGINHSYFIFADDVDPRPTTLAFHPLFYHYHFSAGAELDPSNVLHTLLPTHLWQSDPIDYTRINRYFTVAMGTLVLADLLFRRLKFHVLGT
jgi:hypothetical protein